MCEAEPVRALHFLQTEVSAVVDHSNPTESRTFQDLLADLLAFGSDDEDEVTDGSNTPSEAWTALKRAPSAFEGRTKLFQSLMQFFPTEAKEPSSDLLSLIARSL
jgi:muskelin